MKPSNPSRQKLLANSLNPSLEELTVIKNMNEPQEYEQRYSREGERIEYSTEHSEERYQSEPEKEKLFRAFLKDSENEAATFLANSVNTEELIPREWTKADEILYRVLSILCVLLTVGIPLLILYGVVRFFGRALVQL